MVWGKRKFGRGRPRFYKRQRRRAGFPRKMRRSTTFSRRSYVPPLQPESKYADAAFGLGYQNSNVITAPIAAETAILDANGAATTLASQNAGDNPPQAGIINGAGYNQRIGRRILLKYLSVRMHLYWIQATTTPVTAVTCPPTCRVRIQLFYDRQPNLGLPLAADVMNVCPGLTIETFQEDRNRDRFVRLYDNTVLLSLSSVTGPSFNDGSQAVVNKVIKIGGVQTYNDVGTGTATSIQTGSIFWLFMWDLPGTGAVASTPPCIDLCSRLRYSDL